MYPGILKDLPKKSPSDLSKILETWKNPIFLSKYKMSGIY